METRCRKCNARFISKGVLGVNVCPDCEAEEIEKFEKVKELVKLKPGISVGEVASETGLTYQKIREYIKKLNEI